jgi:hypothetical protein
MRRIRNFLILAIIVLLGVLLARRSEGFVNIAPDSGFNYQYAPYPVGDTLNWCGKAYKTAVKANKITGKFVFDDYVCISDTTHMRTEKAPEPQQCNASADGKVYRKSGNAFEERVYCADKTPFGTCKDKWVWKYTCRP